MKKVRAGRNRRVCTCLIVAALLLGGCGTADSVIVKETDGQVSDMIQQPVQVPTETSDNERKPGAADGFIHSYPLGTVISCDLNGDGIDEDITVNADEYSDGLLTIGNTSVKFAAISPTGYFTVVNVDQSQSFLLIGISDYGFSDDDMTTLYAYDGTRIAAIGTFGDVLGKNSYDKTGAACHGDGTISARVRMDVLGTWLATGLYRMGEAGLEDHTDLYRRMDWDGRITGWEVTAKMDLVMHTDSAKTSRQVTVSAGTPVRMTAVRKGAEENTHWACFEADSFDTKLWLLTEEVEWQTFVYSDERLLNSEEVFDGFFYAG